MAADETSDFAFLAAAARRSTSDIRRVLDRVPRVKDERGSHYLEVIAATLDALDSAVNDRETEFAAASDPADKQAIVVATRQINLYAMSLHGITADIENAAEPPLDLGLVYLVDQLVTDLLKQKADIIMLPGLHYNYSTGFRPFENQLRALGVATYPVSVPPIEVRYPIQEADSLFLHLIVAHEIGHHVIDQEKVDEKVLASDPDPTANAASLNTAISEFETIHSTSKVRARAEVLRRLRGWLNELICDAVAFGVIGPAYLLTFAAFIMPLAGPEPSPTHPPVMLRLKLLLRLMDNWDWGPVTDQEIPTIRAWMKEISERPMRPGTESYYNHLDQILGRFDDQIQAEVEQTLAVSRFTRPVYEQEAGQLRALLDHHVLPAQLDDKSSPNLKTIVLAGWLAALSSAGDEPEALVKIVDNRTYQRFLAKALEMSTVLRTWSSL